MSSDGSRRLAQRLALPAAGVAIAIVALVVGLRLAGATATETSLGRVDLEVRPAIGGGLQLYVPVADWGLRAEAFDSLFELRAELRTLERQALLDAAGGDRSVLEATRTQLRDAALDAVGRALAWTGLTAAVLVALVTLAWPRARRGRWALAAITAGAFVVTAGVCVALARVSFDEGALERPTFYARGAELQRLLAAAENERVTSNYGSEFESILRSVSAVLVDQQIREGGGRELTVGSDLHANVLAIDPLARVLGGVPMLFTGDLGQRGTATEASLLVSKLAALGDPVVAVSGNHDSAALMDELAAAGVRVLGESGGPSATLIDGLRVAGWPDPLAAKSYPGEADRALTFDELDDPDRARERAARDLRRWFDALEPAPDVVMVHQDELGQRLADDLHADGYRRPLTIATGHDHLQHIDRYGSITVVDGGTLGAGGVFEAGEAFAGFAQLHFDAEQPVLRSVDLVAVEPFSGRGRGSRVVIDTLCPEEDRCTYRPSGPQVELPGEPHPPGV